MISRNRRVKAHNKAIFAIFVLLLAFLTSPNNVQGLESAISNLSTGPYVDEVIFKVIEDQDQRVLALQTGEIEMDNSFFEPSYLTTLDSDPNIDIYSAARNGYGQITINCDKYPLNISGFRRAFAFAFNKTRVTSEVMDGFSIEHDSLVPRPNSWCAEDQFDYHYYTAQPDIGNQILDDLNFTIDAETGFRLAPDGTPFEIVIEYGSGHQIYESITQIGVEALDSLHINARNSVETYNYYISRMNYHGAFDMVFFATNFYDNDVDWLAYEYWSENTDVAYLNPTNFRNETYDSYRDALLYGTTYEEIYEAAAEMQKILQYNVPRLVVFVNTYIQAYRNDQFTGHVEDLGNHISGPWTMRKIHKLDGTFGGSVPVSIGLIPNSFNLFITDTETSAPILSELWPSLYKYDSDLEPWPDLAKSMLTETHSDNPAVPDGHTRFTIDIVHNATWTDGTPVTSEDVAFSILYAFESAFYGNPAGFDVGDIYAIYTLSTFSVTIEFSTESYWHFNTFAFDYIIPYHIFNEDEGIAYDEWNMWNPVFNISEPHVTCGPFIFTDYEVGEYYKIERNPHFHYAADPSLPIEPTTNQSTIPEMNVLQVFSISVISGSAIVIIYCVVIIMKEKRSLNDVSE